MIWILIRSGHAYLFRIPRKKWLSYSVLTVLAAIVLICFNYLTAKHVQSTAEGWAVLIGYSGTNFAELGIYITLFFLTPLMEELIYRGLLQHAFFKHSRFGLDLLLPSILFALPHFSSLPSLLDIFVFATSGIIFASLTRYTKSIYPSYAVHVINNIVATLPFLLTFFTEGVCVNTDARVRNDSFSILRRKIRMTPLKWLLEEAKDVVKP